MKHLKIFKILDLLISILFFIMFLYENRITESYEYGLGQLIQFFFLLPVVILLLMSIIMSCVAIIIKNDKSSWNISLGGQIFKIIAFLGYIAICGLWLHIKMEIDYMIIVPIYAVISLIILCVVKPKVNQIR